MCIHHLLVNLPEPSKLLEFADRDQIICLVSRRTIIVFLSGRFRGKNLVTTVPLSNREIICSSSGIMQVAPLRARDEEDPSPLW